MNPQLLFMSPPTLQRRLQRLLFQAIQNTFENRRKFIEAMSQSTLSDAVGTVINLISRYAESES